MDGISNSNTALLERKENVMPDYVETVEHQEKHGTYFLIKRCFDFVSSFCLGIVLLLPMLCLALVVFLKDPGNPFYVQERVGKNGKPLPMVKLRTMRLGADRLEEMLTPKQLAQYKKEYKLDDDPRLIGYKKAGDGARCFGAFLRRTSLDELPQIIWNICIKGNMSVVGPRPILMDELEKNYSLQEQKVLLSVKPGLTGYWQAFARNNAGYEDGKRQSMELYYVHNASVWLDIKIIWQTIFAVIGRNGAK